MYLEDCVCVFSHLTWLSLLGVGRESWYVIIIMMDIKNFANGGGGGVGCYVIHPEKWENHKNSTHSKIKLCIIFIDFFFLCWILKFLYMGGQGGGQGRLSVQKNEKITRAVPILKLNFMSFSFKYFFTMDIKNFLKGGTVKWLARGWVEFFFYILLFYFINVIIKTYIISFLVVYVIYFTHNLYSCVLMCFSLLLKSDTFSARNLSSSTVFDLDGWNKHHFIGNGIPYTRAGIFFVPHLFPLKKSQNSKKYAQKLKIWSKYFSKIKKTPPVTFCSKAL